MSEDSHYTPYEPEPEVCVIDLTSGPPSPVMPEVFRLEQSIENGTIESDPPTYEAAFGPTPSSPILPTHQTNGTVKLRDIQIDMPLISANPASEGSERENELKGPGLLDNLGDPVSMSEDRPIESFFEDAFALTLESQHIKIERRVEQERFDPVDSISRIPVPTLDFTIDEAKWTKHISGVHGLRDSKSHFSWIQIQQDSEENLSPIPGSYISDSSLKWAPVATGAGRVSTDEDLDALCGLAKSFLTLDPEPVLNSGSYFSRTIGLAIERLEEEEELADEIEDPQTPDKPPYTVSSHFEPSIAPSTGATPDFSLGSLISAAASKRRQIQISGVNPAAVPNNQDRGATSKLLEDFMEMRAAKRPRLSSSSANCVLPSTQLPPTPLSRSPEKGHTTFRHSTSSDEPEILTSASAPEAIIPDEKGFFVISIKLERSILRFVEASWPQDHLIDRDYTLHDNLAWSPGGTQRSTITSVLSYDADITLSPTVGIIVTNLTKAKQKPLPKAKTLTHLRDHVLKVSQKFETLFVLVSESNPAGEYTSSLHPSDAAAYADFVRFTISLNAGVSTCFVPGADQTMAKWVLSLMCQYTPNALSSKPYINVVESTWEVFFRRTGMNAFAAQVLAGVVFEKGGNEGLARLMASSPQDIVGTFEKSIGGKKGLINLSEVVCKTWG